MLHSDFEAIERALRHLENDAFLAKLANILERDGLLRAEFTSSTATTKTGFALSLIDGLIATDDFLLRSLMFTVTLEISGSLS